MTWSVLLRSKCASKALRSLLSDSSRISLCNRRTLGRLDMYSENFRSTHLDLTANQPRDDVLADARVAEVKNESDTVKVVTLKLETPEFTFRAGQWVDLIIPGITEVGGFSIWSSPYRLKKDGVVELGVKYARYPPAHWVHTECRVGSKVKIRSGGDFYYDPKHNMKADNVLLIAGGVGVNPLVSILLYCTDLWKHRQDTKSLHSPKNITLLYSARTFSELLYKDMIFDICKKVPIIKCRFFITRDKSEHPKITPLRRRIDHSHLHEALNGWDKNNLLCFICGPANMITDMADELKKAGVDESKIMYEKWW